MTYTIYHTLTHPKHGEYVGCTSKPIHQRAKQIGTELTPICQTEDLQEAIQLEKLYKVKYNVKIKGDTGIFIGDQIKRRGGNPDGIKRFKGKHNHALGGRTSMKQRIKCPWCDFVASPAHVGKHKKYHCKNMP